MSKLTLTSFSGELVSSDACSEGTPPSKAPSTFGFFAEASRLAGLHSSEAFLFLPISALPV